MALKRCSLFDDTALAALQGEFRSSMRRLLSDLCRELSGRYRRQSRALRLTPGHFREVSRALRPEDFSNWKVVGWVEELNDLIYFLDVQWQLSKERFPADFAVSFLVACDKQFYEHTYLDELFPNRKPEPAKLSARLGALCARLARSVKREALFLIPGLLPNQAERVRVTEPNFERAEPAGFVAVGLDGAGVELRHGRVAPPHWIRQGGPDGPGRLTLGPTIIYKRDKTPARISPTRGDIAARIQRALGTIELAWPKGAQGLAHLTNRIVPLKAKGVVSFSYRHRPGLSFINVFDRDDLDLIDDLIHENSHHHLNLLLREAVLYRMDWNQEIFYSPWRRSFRPLRGILHATFTFTMGAILFERLSSFEARGEGRSVRGTIRLTPKQILRARFRCLEEVASVRYSLKDLAYARTLGWLTSAGWGVVCSLKREIDEVARRIAPFERAVLRSKYGRELSRHRKALATARARNSIKDYSRYGSTVTST
ncbi:MAG: aKG-HExxH-type peptide beta-hydroxylase [Nitrospira sp.]